MASLRPVNSNGAFVRMFKFYGLKLEQSNQQLVGDCPFGMISSLYCENPLGHFYANPTTGLWDCKRCGRSGNAYDFIRIFHDCCFSNGMTTEADYQLLSEYRPGISPETLEQHKLAYNPLLDEWLIPSYSLKGTMINLYAYKNRESEKGPIPTIMSGPTFKQLLYGLQHYRRESRRPLWLLEGHWDLLAFHEMVTKLGVADQHDYVAVPGSHVFPDEDLALFSLRDVRLCYDHDSAGEEGILKVCNKMGINSITPKKLWRMNWTGLEKGYDVRDLINDNGHKVAWSKLNKDLAQELNIDLVKSANAAYSPNNMMIPCNSFTELTESIGKPGKLYLPPSLQDTFCIVMAIAATTKLGGKPTWGFIVAPSSAGKTTLIDLFSTAHNHCFFMSKMTGLLSGYFKEGMGDASILPKIQDHCLVIKDFTPILKASQQAQDNIFGELRDVYDGSTAAYYRNHVKAVYNDVRFNILACVTDAIRGINQTDVGERFIQIEYDSYWNPQGFMERDSINKSALVKSAMSNVFTKINGQSSSGNFLSEQKAQTWGFIDYLYNRINDDRGWVHSKVEMISSNIAFCEYIENLSMWCNAARATVKRDKDKQLSHRPRLPYPQRFAEVLCNMAVGVSLVLDEDDPNGRVKDIIRKIALDSGLSFQQEIMFAIAHSEGGALSIGDISTTLNVSQTHVLNHLRDMQELNIVKYHIPAVRIRGNQPHIYALTPEYVDIAKALGFYLAKE